MKKFPYSHIFHFSSAIFFVGAVFIISLSFFSLSANSATTSKDAIAIRVLPNTNHYSPVRWYSEQGFSGSPQSMLVDGYEAIRDGRTVYVNVANVVGTKLYTNIYLISYNQAAESATLDIFGKILAHWKFNTNITTTGHCSQDTEKVCLSDADCASDEHCDSAKAKIIRDTKRLSDLAELQTAIENYFSQYDYYPKITSGTYLANKSISTWPSWSATLGAELGVTMLVDPINKLGDCGGNSINKNGNQYAGANASQCLNNGSDYTGSCVNAYWDYSFSVSKSGDYQAFIESTNAGSSDLSVLTILSSMDNATCPASGGQHKIEIYMDGVLKGHICNDAVASTQPHQIGYVDLGFITAGAHTMKYKWVNDFVYNPGYIDSNVRIYKVGLTESSDYDSVTCWDAASKRFAGAVDGNSLTLPVGSNVYTYSAAADGSSYGLNMGTESGSLNADGSYSYNGGGGGGGTAGGGGGATTSKSVFTGTNIEEGYSGKAFSAIVEAENPNQATLIWKVVKITYQHDNAGAIKTWTYASGNPGVDSNGVSAVDFLKSGDCLWDSPELLATTGVDKQRKIIAEKMGKAGTYIFSISLDENNGTLPTVKDFSFTAKNDSPIVFNVIALKNITIGHNLDYIVAQATDDIKYNHYPMAFSISTTDAGAPELKCKQNPAVSCEQAEDKVNCGSELDGGVYQCHIAKTAVVADTKEYTYKIIASDYYGEQTQSSFKIKVENNPPNVDSISLSNTDAIVGCPYMANVLATDYAADGHNITEWLSGNLATNFSGATINAGTGAVSWPSASAGAHTFEATVRDQYYSYTKSPYIAESKKNLSVTPQTFTINDISGSSIYNYPSTYAPTWNDGYHPFYYPTLYEKQASVSIPDNVSYSLQGSPSWLAVDAFSGLIQGTPATAGSYTVKVRATKNPCGIYAETPSFVLTVSQNQWCGDGLVQNAYGEECETAGYKPATASNKQYACSMSGTTSCKTKGGYCGDGVTQTTYGENCDSAGSNASTCDPGYKTAGPHSCSYCKPDTCISGKVWGKYCGDGSVTDSEKCETGGTGASLTDQYGCTSCAWSGGYRGDGAINGGEQCDGTSLNGKTCATKGFDFGSLSCKSDGTFETGACGTHGSQTFTSSGTFTVPNAVTAVTVTMVAGGGGGGGGNGYGYGKGHGAGGGGGGGVLENQAVSGLTSGASIAVTVGAGGAGGDNDGDNDGDPNNSYGEPGGGGGSSSFGSYTTAYGGGGGGRAEYGNSAPAVGGTAGGSGGTAGGAGGAYDEIVDYCPPRDHDICSTTYTRYYGASGGGGNSMNGSSIGGAGLPRVLDETRDSATSADNGNSGTGYGAGGGGATSDHFSGGTGGGGNSGYVTITW